MNKFTRGALVAASALSVAAVAGPANAATTDYNMTFEKGYDTVLDAQNGWYGDIQKVRSGKDGNVVSSGSGSKFHAIAAEDENETGPFTRFSGYSSVFGNGFTTSVDVYIDPTLSEGEGFEWSSAVSGSDGLHQRDFIFHVQKIGEDVKVGVSNNSGSALSLPANAVTVAAGQWVTLKADFRDDAGFLAVDMTVDGVFIETRSSTEDTIGVDGTVGGNRYGWLTMIEDDSVAVDNITLVRS